MIQNIPHLTSKLPQFGPSIFSVMTAMSNKHGAINLAQGFPDINTPDFLIERFYHHMKEGRNQYAPMPGVPVLKEKIAAKLEKLYGINVDPGTEITVTAGATQAISLVINTVVHEGDEVIIFEPAYDSYLPCIQLNKGVAKFAQLNPPDYSINWEQVKELVTSRTKLIIINNPHNPTGTLLHEKDLAALQRLVEGSNILILSDEVYEHITFDGLQHLSICKYPELAARSFTIFSFGKTYHNTGWKTGYVVAPAALTAELRKVLSYSMFSVLTPAQYALADILEHEQYYLELNAFYQQKRDLFLEGIKGAGLKPTPCQGTYFLCADYSDLSDMKDTDFAAHLVREIGVGAIPVSAFYHNGQDNKILRFCFAKRGDTLDQALERLQKLTP
jgi:methionine transaminase